MYDWAKPGVKVVCVDGKPYLGHPDDIWPITGSTYTIREVFLSEYYVGEVHVRLVEIVNTEKSYRGFKAPFEAGFNVRRFKPLVSKSLPASLTNLLKNPKSVILPNEGNRWDVKKQPQKVR